MAMALDKNTQKQGSEAVVSKIKTVSEADQDVWQLKKKVAKLVIVIDRLLNAQLSAIIENEIFSSLEARWRGLQNVVWDLSDNSELKVKLLNITWDEVSNDLNSQIRIRDTFLYKIVGLRELDTMGGEPFGILCIDHYLNTQNNTDFDDLYTAQLLCALGESCACPIITSVDDNFFGEADAAWKTDERRLKSILASSEFSDWNNLRNRNNSRFLGLVMPKVLIRTKYASLNIGFNFTQLSSQTSGLWGNGCIEFIRTVMCEFHRTAWFGYLKMVSIGPPAGAVIPPACSPLPEGTMRNKVAQVRLTRGLGQFFSTNGFIPICESVKTHDLYCVGNRSVQNCFGSFNREILTQIQSVLIGCRMTHYLKVLIRSLVGQINSASECEQILVDWIRTYCANLDQAAPELLAKFPLKHASLSVEPVASSTGTYACRISIVPQYQIDCHVGEVMIATELDMRASK